MNIIIIPIIIIAQIFYNFTHYKENQEYDVCREALEKMSD